MYLAKKWMETALVQERGYAHYNTYAHILFELGYLIKAKNVAEKALEYKLGARGLRSICEAILTDAMFEIPSNKEVKKLKITEAYAKGKFDKSKLSKLKVAS